MDDAVRRAVAGMRNDDVEWAEMVVEEARTGRRRPGRWVVGPLPRPQTPTAEAAELSGGPANWPTTYRNLAPTTRALLNALEDPNKALAAHAVLYGSVSWEMPPGQQEFTRSLGELPVRLRLSPGLADARVVVRADVPDPAAWAALRSRWHDRLDVRIGTVPDSLLLSATALPPLLWCCAWTRRDRKRRRRVRLGLCLACGYDMRHSPEKCPEMFSRL
jgi:hypothetical protein